VNGKIALVDRGTCNFTVKVKNCQDAGAIGVVVVDNAAGSPPPPMGGLDDTLTIPAVRVTKDDGARLKAILADSSMTVTIGLNSTVRAGADRDGRVLLYTPDPYESGSSVSHWDTIATPNLLMEPTISADLKHEVSPPADLSLQLLKDLGWNPPPPDPPKDPTAKAKAPPVRQ
jgi:hypothetical protein